VCNRDERTTVLAHMNGGGMGLKHNDMFGAYACSACHDAVDGRSPVGAYSKCELQLMFVEGIIRTQQILLDEGLIKIEN